VTRAVCTVARIVLRGDAVGCPCCGGRFRTFLAYPDGFCPGCGSYPRHRQLAVLLERRPELLRPRSRVLHVGPERCMQRVFARMGRLDYVAVDRAHPLATHTMDVRRLSFDERSFDFVVCFHVLVFLPDKRDATRELARVLASGGSLVLSDPSPDEYAPVLEAQGLEVEAVRADALGTLGELERYGLVADERLLVARR